MKIREITYRHRRDFSAIYICEHCGTTTKTGDGYDDQNFHRNVVPRMKCPQCGERSPSDYEPLEPKYPDYQTV